MANVPHQYTYLVTIREAERHRIAAPKRAERKRRNRRRVAFLLGGSLSALLCSTTISRAELGALWNAIELPVNQQEVAENTANDTGYATHTEVAAQATTDTPEVVTPLENQQSSEYPQESEEPAHVAEPAEPEITYPRALDLTVASGDTLMDMLVESNVEQEEAANAVRAIKASYNPSSLKIGQQISLNLDASEEDANKAQLSSLTIKVNPMKTITLERTAKGFDVDAIEKQTKPAPHYAVGKVRATLYQAALDAGIPSSMLGDLIKSFSYDVDFQRDIQPGDTIAVLLDRKVTDDGYVAGVGNFYYAELKMRNETVRFYHYKDKNGDWGFYNDKGESIKKALLRTPMNGARISSGFGMRRHPIQGYNKMHKGVDFAAATGTPIYAAGDGTVAFAGRKGGYGNYIVVKHNNTYSTAYGHVSRFGKFKVGQRVKQGQVVAYVGSTGMSTGPHLHYEVLKNGEQVNPASQKFNAGRVLEGKELVAFNTAKQRIKNQIATLTRQRGTQMAMNE